MIKNQNTTSNNLALKFSKEYHFFNNITFIKGWDLELWKCWVVVFKNCYANQQIKYILSHLIIGN